MDSSSPEDKFEEELMQINTSWCYGTLNEYVSANIPIEVNQLK